MPLCQDVLVECTTCQALGKGPDAHFLHKPGVRAPFYRWGCCLARCSPHLPFVPQTWGPPSSRCKGPLGVLSTIVEHSRCDALTCQSFEEPSVFSFFRIRNFREICCGRLRSWTLSLQCVSVSVYILKNLSCLWLIGLIDLSSPAWNSEPLSLNMFALFSSDSRMPIKY